MEEMYITSRNTGKEYSSHVLFARNTKEKIKSKIKGSVHTDLNGETLLIKIYGANEIVFSYEMRNLSYAIVRGFTSDRLAQIVVNRYTQYLKNLFFL